jgi:putative restriction endonuclease
MHRADSIYNDSPAERYQFPRQYLTRVQPTIGDWIIYLEPTKVRNTRGYFAVAKVETIVPDPTKPNMFLALIEPGSYIDFSHSVPFRNHDGPLERGLLNQAGVISGRAQSAVRPLSPNDFRRIVETGLSDQDRVLPRTDEVKPSNLFSEERLSFEIERPVIQSLISRKKRDQLFRRAVLAAYDSKCGVTGWKLINGGGRAEAEAAHIKPVEHAGPDSIQNGIALSGTVHWMFDRGLIGLSDELEILVHRKVNDRQGVEAMINSTGRLQAPALAAHRPHPAFLAWHRDFHGFS